MSIPAGRSGLSSNRPDHADEPVSVVICAYSLERWADIAGGVAAVAGQTRPPSEIVLAVDNNAELYARAAAELVPTFPLLRLVENESEPGLSGARNTAIRSCRSALIAFLDDDARPDPDWLANLIRPFNDPQVWVTGGKAEPGWPAGRPAWFPPEFDWVVGSSYTGLPTAEADVRNVIGCSMAFRKSAFDEVGLFELGVGRVGKLPFGCEETELCIRLTNKLNSVRIVYAPTSLVAHRVSPDRTQLKYFMARCIAEGRSKALIGQLIGHQEGTASERSYVSKVLTRGVVRNLLAAVRGDLAALRRAGAIVLGLGLTSYGYGRGRASAFSVPGRNRP